jgi:hypothetical protein
MEDTKNSHDMPHDAHHEGPHHGPMSGGSPMMMHGKKMRGLNFWATWKSPVGLGFFLLTASLAAAIILYTLLNLFVSVSEAMHPADSSSGMSQQQLEQELEQAQPTSATGATGAAQ